MTYYCTLNSLNYSLSQFRNNKLDKKGAEIDELARPLTGWGAKRQRSFLSPYYWQEVLAVQVLTDLNVY